MGKYVAVFRLAVVHSLKSWKGLIGLTLFLITCLVIFAHLWRAAAAKLGAVHLDPSQLLWYIALNEWVLIAIPDVRIDMERDLKSGRLAYLLPRPISYLGGVFAQGLGMLCVHLLILGSAAFLFTWWKLNAFPFDLASFVVLWALALLAGSVALIFQMAVGLSAFWIGDVGPFHWLWEKFLFALGGLIVPLSIYPIWIQKIAYCTPFPVILGQRSALALQWSAAEVVHIGITLFFWGVLGTSCLMLLYRRGLRILNLEGG